MWFKYRTVAEPITMGKPNMYPPQLTNSRDVFMFALSETRFICRRLKIENCTMLIPKGNSYCRHKSSARRPLFKLSSEGLSAEIDILLWSPIQVQTKTDVA